MILFFFYFILNKTILNAINQNTIGWIEVIIQFFTLVAVFYGFDQYKRDKKLKDRAKYAKNLVKKALSLKDAIENFQQSIYIMGSPGGFEIEKKNGAENKNERRFSKAEYSSFAFHPQYLQQNYNKLKEAQKEFVSYFNFVSIMDVKISSQRIKQKEKIISLCKESKRLFLYLTNKHFQSNVKENMSNPNEIIFFDLMVGNPDTSILEMFQRIINCKENSPEDEFEKIFSDFTNGIPQIAY